MPYKGRIGGSLRDQLEYITEISALPWSYCGGVSGFEKVKVSTTMSQPGLGCSLYIHGVPPSSR